MKIALMTSGTIKSSLSYRPLALARELVKKGHEVYILAPRFDKYSKFIDEKLTNIDGVKIVRPFQMKAALFELGLIPYVISSIFMLLKLNPDIVHIFKPNPVTIGGLLLKCIKNTPIVLDVDDLDTEVMAIENNPKLKIKLVEMSEKILSKHANAITVGSKFLKKMYESQYKNKLITYIPNGAEFINIQKLSLHESSQNGIVFIGNINRINILDPLFYAIQKLQNKVPNISVTIIGDGIYLNYFKNLVKTLGINKNVIFLGHVQRNILGRYVKTGDIGYCYMPNERTIKACSSMKVFQYMQFGVIPLVSNVGDLPSYTFNGKAGYVVKNGNVNELTREMRAALSNKRDLKEKICFIQKNAEKAYGWSTLENKVEKVYRKVYGKDENE